MVKIAGVSFSYGEKIILKDIDFSLNKGEFFCIAGPNGAGKSTLVKLIARLLKPSGGNISLKGKNIRDYERKDFYSIVAVVTQTPSFEFLRVREFVSLGRLPHFKTFQLFEKKTDKESIDRVLKLCGIEGLKNKYMTMISGGERQLVFLARALVSDPELLLLDEPLNNLDIAHQQRILDLLMKLKYEFNLTIISVLHDLNVASEFADSLILLGGGQIIAMGSPKEIIKEGYISKVYSLKDPVIYENPVTRKPHICICRR